MGSGRSGLYPNTSGSTKSSSIESNVKAMSEKYPLTSSGYFGEKGKNCRIIKSNDPIDTSEDFYQTISKGGTTTNLLNGKGIKTILDDGTVIVYRLITSTKGSPAIEISVSGSSKIKNQKIHFIQEGNNDK